MLKRILLAAVEGARAVRAELHRAHPAPDPLHRHGHYGTPRDCCEVCDTEPTTDVREIRLDRAGHRLLALRVCANHARMATTRVIAEFEAAIDDGHACVPNDEVYG